MKLKSFKPTTFVTLKLDDQKEILRKLVTYRGELVTEDQRLTHAESLIAVTKGYFNKVLSNYYCKLLDQHFDQAALPEVM